MTDRCPPFWSSGGLGLLVLLLAVPAAQAQDSTVTATVTYVAGQNAYLDVGSRRGITGGDTLVVRTDNTVRGRLIVKSSSSTESVVTFAGVPFPITRGDVLTLLHIPGPAERDPPAVADERSDTTRAERRDDEPPARPVRSDRSTSSPQGQWAPRLTGSVSLRLRASRTSTRQGLGTDETLDRRYATPSAAVNARVTQLPGDAVVRINARGSYRYVDNASPITPKIAVHAYQLSVEKDFGATSLQAGRFYNRYEPYSDYWDGLLVHRGSSSSGIGVAVGVRPQRGNERPLLATPKVTAFAHYETSALEALEYRVNGSYHEVRPRDARPTHRFVGLMQAVEWGALSVRQDLQVDQDPKGNGWRPSRLRVRASMHPVDPLRLRVHYSRREPYFLHDPRTPFGALRAEVGGGATVLLSRATIGGEVTMIRPTGPFEEALIYRGRVSVPSIAYGIGLFGSGTLRTAKNREVQLGSVGLSKHVLGAHLRVRYRYYRTTQRRAILVSHSGMLSTTVPLPGDYRLSASVRVRRDDLLNRVSVHTGLRIPL